MGGIPPGFLVQGGFFAEMTPEMGRSQPVRIQNTKFCNIPTIMKKVMDDRKPIFFTRKKNWFRGGNELAL
jgi:hypothetical protein